MAAHPSASATKRAGSLRSDAELNRTRIVTAAREVFAEGGLDAPLNEVARRAGVGIATLYRRFPTRDELISATFEAKMTAYADGINAALDDSDPWNGFCRCVERICRMQAEDRGFTHVLTMTFPTALALEAERARAFRGFNRLIARAKAAGELRQDFSHADLVILLMANAGVIQATGDAAPGAWRRLVAFMLQAFRASNSGALPPLLPPSKGPFQTMTPTVGTPARGPGSAQ